MHQHPVCDEIFQVHGFGGLDAAAIAASGAEGTATLRMLLLQERHLQQLL